MTFSLKGASLSNYQGALLSWNTSMTYGIALAHRYQLSQGTAPRSGNFTCLLFLTAGERFTSGTDTLPWRETGSRKSPGNPAPFIYFSIKNDIHNDASPPARTRMLFWLRDRFNKVRPPPHPPTITTTFPLCLLNSRFRESCQTPTTPPTDQITQDSLGITFTHPLACYTALLTWYLVKSRGMHINSI